MGAVDIAGSDYDHDLDQSRLAKQHDRIRDYMLDGVWRALFEIAEYTGDPEASISAQLRHLRKLKNGQYVLQKRRRGDRKGGLFEYRVLPPGSDVETIKQRRNKLKELAYFIWDHPESTLRLKYDIKKFLTNLKKAK